MTLTKNFLHKKPESIKISRFKLIVGILLGLFYSFAFYSFLYLIREVFRFVSVTETYDSWVLADHEVYFYNLIFALISVVIGQSVTFTFWFDRPRRISEKRKYRKTSIVNDQRALTWCFLSWFSGLALSFGVLFGIGLYAGFYVFNLYPNYNYIFILIVVVLFLQSWNTIRLTYKRKSLKWLLSSIVILSIIAFGFSRINLIDYKAVNGIYLQYNIPYNYNLELPESNTYESFIQLSLIENIYIVEPKNQQSGSEPIIIVDDENIGIEKLREKIAEWKSLRDGYDVPRMVYRLHIHKTIKMGFVKKVKSELINSDVSTIAYAVIPTNREYDDRYYQNLSFTVILPDWSYNSFVQSESNKGISKSQNIIEINQMTSGCFINDSLVKPNEITYTLKRLIQENSDYKINFQVDDNVEFSEYFKVLSSVMEAIDDIRNDYAEKESK